MCYHPDPEDSRRVVAPIPDGHKSDGDFGLAHIETDTVWELMELLQCYVAAFRLPTDESADQGLASQRLLAATARMLARVTEVSIAEWQEERDGDGCRTRLADLGRLDAEVRATAVASAATAAQRADPPEAEADDPTEVVDAFYTLSQVLKRASTWRRSPTSRW
jgi:hypothetical protein